MSKKFIICGTSRSGKSLLSKRISSKLDLSWIIGDALVSSMEDAFPDLGVSHHGDLQDIGNKFEEFIKYLLWNYAYEGTSYVFDSTHLYPAHIAKIRSKIGIVPTIFLGYADANVEQKLREIRQFDPAENWWTRERSDEELISHIQNQIEKSRQIKAQCLEFDMPYIETSQDFISSIAKAEEILTKL